ncbi:MAG TPA: hypothetical protein ENJ64_00530 [Thiotrichales bacterium]|nr:hypothetical protein [Thiotrichales bacterium]
MQEIQDYLTEKEAAYAALDENVDPVERARLQLDVAEALVGVNRADEAWEKARSALQVFIENEQWQDAAESCDVLYQTAQPASLVALAHGVWLAVTYPVEPQLTVNLLGYIIDETPPNADGAAVAAITAHYIADIRADDAQHKSLTFLTQQMVANVAEAHSSVKDQDALNQWMERLQLRDPAIFLPKLSLVLGAIVPADQWWFDRDALREKLPD